MIEAIGKEIELIKQRIKILESRGSHNSSIVNKLYRKIRALEKKNNMA